MKKLTTITFIERAIKKHGQLYDYSNTKYTHSHEPVIIICKKHGEFHQRAAKHLEGSGCKKCATEKIQAMTNMYRGGRHPRNTKQFVNQAIKRHGEKYEYLNTEYQHSHTPVNITCQQHGEFQQTPSCHLEGRGCPICANEQKSRDYTMTTEYFISRSKKVHNNVYDYSNSEYINAKTKVSILCNIHGDFKQYPHNHYAGTGCPKCFKYNSSKKEQDWLDACGIADDDDHRQVRLTINNNTYIVDGFNPCTNTVYEFWGDFWHGHPNKYDPDDYNPVVNKTFGELYEKTNQKRLNILTEGYHLVEMWESDWCSHIVPLNSDNCRRE